MTTTLITFLGRTPKDQNGYRRTRYDFGDDEAQQAAAFFGWPLANRVRPERLVILGTAGSMWDHLFEEDVEIGEAEEQRLALIESVDNQSVTQSQLDRLSPLLRQHFGAEITLRLIPYGYTHDEQVELLTILANQLNQGDKLHLDVTHAFRHLPMIALMAAFYLSVAKQVNVEKVWYGAFNPDTGDAPVYDLSGLLKIATWSNALSTYDKDGDYGVFAPLLGDKGALLNKAAYFERTTNPVKAREALNGWRSRDDVIPNEPIAQLFSPEIIKRTEWIKLQGRAQWEKHLALTNLNNRDYLRASIYMLEALISHACEKEKRNINDYKDREITREELKNKLEGFRTLSHLRNTLVHGVKQQDKIIKKIIPDESNLSSTIKNLHAELWKKV